MASKKMTEKRLPFTVMGINHIGLAPKDPAQAERFFEALLGLQSLGAEHIAAQQVKTIMLTSSVVSQENTAADSSRLEILESTSEQGPISRFIAKKGSGIHHLAMTVDDLQAAIKHLLANKIRMIDNTPRDGAHDTRIAFVHPESTGGLLIELVEVHSL